MQQIRARVATGAGLEPPPWVLEARVVERMRKLDLVDAATYAERLANRVELACLVELLRVGETSFFRHQNQLRALEDIVVPDLQKTTGAVRVWSAGCATGEEPYTLAMLLSRALPGGRKLSILASDISEDCVKRARAAIYSSSASQTVPALHRGSFERLDATRTQVCKRIRDLVEFEERNLSLGSYPAGFDVIFCRNVLIYFAPDARRTALKRLVLSLRPGGYLFLGYSESLREVEGLEPVTANDATVYRRAAASPGALSAQRSSRNSTSPPRVRSPEPPTRPAPIASRPAPIASRRDEMRLQGEYADAKRLSKELREALQRPGLAALLVDLDGADYLGEAAAAVLKQMEKTAHALNVELRWSASRVGHLHFLRRHQLRAAGAAKEEDA